MVVRAVQGFITAFSQCYTTCWPDGPQAIWLLYICNITHTQTFKLSKDPNKNSFLLTHPYSVLTPQHSDNI